MSTKKKKKLKLGTKDQSRPMDTFELRARVAENELERMNERYDDKMNKYEAEIDDWKDAIDESIEESIFNISH